MAKYLTLDELDEALTHLRSEYRVLAPAYEHHGGRFEGGYSRLFDVQQGKLAGQGTHQKGPKGPDTRGFHGCGHTG